MIRYHQIHNDGERRAIVEYNEDGGAVAFYAVRITWTNADEAPTKEQISEYVKENFPETWCQHEREDRAAAEWSEFTETWETPNEKTIIVRQYSYQNT